jgi:hypothetical protein
LGSEKLFELPLYGAHHRFCAALHFIFHKDVKARAAEPPSDCS